MFKLPVAKLQHIDSYFVAYERHIMEMIDERRAMGQQGHDRNDLFSRLIKASDAESDTAKLNQQELLADIHVFLLAGHETVSGALTATQMLLALHPEHQEMIAKEAEAAFGVDGEDHGFDKFGELVSCLVLVLLCSTQLICRRWRGWMQKYTLAVFMESLRLFPCVHTDNLDLRSELTMMLTLQVGQLHPQGCLARHVSRCPLGPD